MPEVENQLEQQQKLAMLVELYFESHNCRVVGLDDQSRECIAEWFAEADDLFGDKSALVFELLNVFSEAKR